jgi:hypothetical protein
MQRRVEHRMIHEVVKMKNRRSLRNSKKVGADNAVNAADAEDPKKHRLDPVESVETLKKRMCDLTDESVQVKNRIDSFDQVMAQMQERIYVLETKVRNLESGTSAMNKYSQFAKLTTVQKQMFVAGDMTGLSYPKNDGDKSANKIMCCNYKSVCNDDICESRRVITVNGSQIYASDEAKYLDLVHFSKGYLRELDPNFVVGKAKHYMICRKCREKNTAKHFVEPARHTENCCMCITTRASKNVNTISDFMMCSACSNVVAHVGNIGAELCVYECLNVVGIMFRDIVKIHKNHYVNVASENGINKSHNMDIFMCGCDFLIIIEKDENQHLGYNKENEHKKIKNQIKAVLSGDLQKQKKLFVVRYNPNGKYKGADGELVKGYDSSERLIILRRWVIWFILNVKNVRKCMVLYMWYNFDHQVLCNEFDGIFKVYDAPANETGKWDWCPIHAESTMTGINKKAVRVDDVLADDGEGRERIRVARWRESSEKYMYADGMI